MEISLGQDERREGRRLAVELLTERISGRGEEEFLETLGRVLADAGDLSTVAATLRASTFLASSALRTSAERQGEDPETVLARLALFLEQEEGEP